MGAGSQQARSGVCYQAHSSWICQNAHKATHTSFLTCALCGCACCDCVCLQDLLLAANDQPFRFPATFTFVVRSFTVLDGIGKSLDPRFDISEISAPYARNLLLEGQPQVRLPRDCVFVGMGKISRKPARAMSRHAPATCNVEACTGTFQNSISSQPCQLCQYSCTSVLLSACL